MYSLYNFPILTCILLCFRTATTKSKKKKKKKKGCCFRENKLLFSDIRIKI